MRRGGEGRRERRGGEGRGGRGGGGLPVWNWSSLFVSPCSEDVTELYPQSKVMEDVATQKDQLYGRDSLHETYYLVTNTHTQCYIHPPCTTAKSHLLSLSCAAQKTIGKKGIGTLSKKFKAPEITDQDRIRAAAEVKKNTIKGEIIGLWKRVKVGGGGGL